MRILYVSHLHPPKNKPLKNLGGMQNVSVQMIKALGRRDDVEIESLILQSSWKFIGIKTFFFLISLFWRIPFAIRRYNPDVILFSSMVTAGVLPAMVKKPKIPVVTINHGQDVTLPVSIYQWYLKYVFRNLNGVISVSSATRQASIERGMDPKKGIALPNGYDEHDSEKLPDRQEAIEFLGKDILNGHSEKKILLTVGRQVKRKGHQWFIEEVLPKLKSDFVYLIVGSGPEYKNIEQAGKLSPLSDRIIMTGKLPKKMLRVCYAASDLFVMPNIPVPGDMEGFGIVLLEANRAGLPAVASDLEGIKDVIKQGVNGYRVPHGDADKFSAQIDKILEGDIQKLSESARDYVVKTFNWDTVVKKYVDYLRSLNV